MKGFLNKRINKIKLALTTECNLRCPYCFVDKTNERMEWDVAKKSVDILMRSKGKNKLLSMYGGEPLLNFSLIRKVCPYAIREAKKNDKNLIISICTNLTLLNESHISFIKNHGVKLIFSLVGEKHWHDRFRVFGNKKGTHDLILSKLPMLRKNINNDNIGVSLCVFPDTAPFLERNFMYILKLGFRYINIEIIRDFKPWTKNDIMAFEEGYSKVLDYVTSGIEKNDFLFINPVNWEITHSLLTESRKTQCPFNHKLEIYPDGEVAFSPFLLNDENKNRFLIANLKEDKQYRFGTCEFSEQNRECQSCLDGYFNTYKSDEGANDIQRIYLDLSLETARSIIGRAEHERRYRDYVIKIKRDVCF